MIRMCTRVSKLGKIRTMNKEANAKNKNVDDVALLFCQSITRAVIGRRSTRGCDVTQRYLITYLVGKLQ